MEHAVEDHLKIILPMIRLCFVNSLSDDFASGTAIDHGFKSLVDVAVISFCRNYKDKEEREERETNDNRDIEDPRTAGGLEKNDIKSWKDMKMVMQKEIAVANLNFKVLTTQTSLNKTSNRNVTSLH
ncbi:hypothetical protein KGF57_002952 [Candida theae]|uniref:Uncharacterized protein n=1 Tax=Candida theae TaxID=1198502 RepID=A0AAD5BE89_9ASCO|nr:uncharacterized protein KGF57_002952 [Candida theae]KAI5957686.1 hypothetical protein KGF57_002952 [Candida theae]